MSAPRSDAPLTILYRDDHLVAVSKPSGLLVHRSPEARDRTFLLQRLATQLDLHLYPVHRLDRAASGIIVFGLSSADARWIQEALQRETTCKEYLVLVRGRTPEAFSSGKPLTNEAGTKQPARTTFTREALFAHCSLLHARLFTGRRHQIRRHLNHLGHHVVGDTTHGKGHVNRAFRTEFGLHRLFLHATRLAFRHAITGEELALDDPLPPGLQSVVDGLSRGHGTLP